MTNQKKCPFCGSADLAKVAASQTLSLNGDRLCRDCGAQWAPPLPKWAAAVFLPICIVLSCMGLICIWAWRDTHDVVPLMIGITCLVTFVLSAFKCLCILFGPDDTLTIVKPSTKNPSETGQQPKL